MVNIEKNKDNLSFIQGITAKKLLDKTSIIKKKPNSILDLGAGYGNLSDMLVDNYPDISITTVDNSQEACSFLANNPNLKSICADARNLPFSDWSYSVIYSNLMLHCISDYQKVFTEVKRILAPGGYFIMSNLGPETLREVRECWAAVDDFRHVNDFPHMQVLADNLAQQGFIDVVVSNEKIVIRYDSVRDIIKDLQNMGTSSIGALDKYKDSMTHAKIAKFYRKYEEFKLEDGSYPVTYEIVYAICWAKDKAANDAKEHLVSVDHLRNIMRRFQDTVTD